jgi:hypothetical protein
MYASCAECHFLISKSLVFGMGSFYIYLTMAFSVDLDNTRF